MTKIAFNKHSVGNLNLGNRFECLLSLEVNINLIFGLKMSIFWNLVKTLRICYYSVMEVVGLNSLLLAINEPKYDLQFAS